MSRPGPRTRAVGVGLAALLMIPAAGAAQAAPVPTAHRLARTALPGVLLQHRVGAAPAGRPWHVGVSVRGKDAAGLARLERGQYTPGSAEYHRYLTPAQYVARFGALATDQRAVRSWAVAHGLTVKTTNAAGTYLTLTGTIGQVERTFGTTLGRYSARGLTFVANDRGPTVPVAVTAVSGLDEVSTRLHTHAVPSTAFPFAVDTNAQQLWKAYEQPASNRGKGEKLAAFGWGSPAGVTDDLRTYEAANNLPRLPFKTVQVGDPGTDTAGRIEWNLDSQAASGMAPDASGMTFYFAQDGYSDLLAASISRWADDPAGAKQASASYGLCDVLNLLGGDPHEGALTQAVVEGRSVFVSSGDSGSGCSLIVGVNGVLFGPVPSQSYPATSPHAVAVGGTVLYSVEGGRSPSSEIAWTHSGGGPSYSYARPAWQNVPLASARRAVSDVSAQSGDLTSGYRIINAGQPTTVGGTSLSAPLWQGMWARINAAGPRGSDGIANIGFAPPVIYANNANATTYARDFNDITVGANGAYSTLPGYDYPTGWGTPRVANLMKDLTGRLTPR